MLKFWIVVVTFRNGATFVVGNHVHTDILNAKIMFNNCDKTASHFELPEESNSFGPIIEIELIECMSNKTVETK